MSKRKTYPPASLQIEDHNLEREGEYVASQWSGREHYVCKKCAGFDTFSKAEMLNHLINFHNSESALDELMNPASPIAPPQMSTFGEGKKEKEINNGKTNVDED